MEEEEGTRKSVRVRRVKVLRLSGLNRVKRIETKQTSEHTRLHGAINEMDSADEQTEARSRDDSTEGVEDELSPQADRVRVVYECGSVLDELLRTDTATK